ncbi:hypothetical protein NN4_12480 [Nocardia ninae NBRC 108245]|uniref:Uncharacterized protein n=1 Tax=Nocardia ninae NBRC 108245 TaxID=1210091 RepID=A0A511M802_9NOCA|nr:hypothetical protein NN4_12480 [Nocardia ninae NBRC 108245]
MLDPSGGAPPTRRCPLAGRAQRGGRTDRPRPDQFVGEIVCPAAQDRRVLSAFGSVTDAPATQHRPRLLDHGGPQRLAGQVRSVCHPAVVGVELAVDRDPPGLAVRLGEAHFEGAVRPLTHHPAHPAGSLSNKIE